MSGATTRRPPGLARQVSVLVAASCVITAVLALVVSVGVVRRVGENGSRVQLARLADTWADETDRVAAAQARSGGVDPVRALAALAPVRRTLAAVRAQSATVDPAGTVTTRSPLAERAATAPVVRGVLAGHKVSRTLTVDGDPVLVEGRPTATGGVVLVERRADARALGATVLGRVAWALLAAVALTGAAGVLLTRRLTRPLRRTADAALALAGGRRDVVVPPEGPREVAEVAGALNTLTGALRHSEGRQREFLLSVSHDLRTPLTSITGFAESLRTGVVPPGDVAAVAATVELEARRLDRLVSDLLDLARLEADEVRLDVGPVDLTAVVTGAGPTWAARCARDGVDFRVEPAPGPVVVRTDAGRVRQVLDGLLDNALRMTPAGAPVVLAMRPAGPGRVAVDVRDGGPGLAEDDLAVAFDRGALHGRYRGVRQVGTGLGLAIVARLAERLGIGVEAGHAPEGGARFSLLLDLADA